MVHRRRAQNRITSMVGGAAGLGAVAAARLGRADRDLRPQGRQATCLSMTKRERAHCRSLRARGRRCLVCADAAARFLAPDYKPEDFDKIDDVLNVWFDSGSTHAFTLEDAKDFPGLSGIQRIRDGGRDEVMYLEGSDQHRGWFQSSLLESSGTRGRAPFDIVLTHGFTLDENGRKMSKSLGNVVAPQTVIEQSGADILRFWVAASDYSDDLRIGPEILKTFVETYRKLRNTIRWMLGSLAHYDAGAEKIGFAEFPELERLMLHRLAELDADIREAYARFDYKRVVARFHGLSQHRSFGLLFRHPQGHALLRSPVEPQAPRRARTPSSRFSAP